VQIDRTLQLQQKPASVQMLGKQPGQKRESIPKRIFSMVSQTSELLTSYEANCHRPEQSLLVLASELQAGQQVLYGGRQLTVRRVVPAFTRSQACHVHLLPLNWQPSPGVSQRLADREEAAVLVRVACPVFKPFQVVAG
jgi:hypothetical protein